MSKRSRDECDEPRKMAKIVKTCSKLEEICGPHLLASFLDLASLANVSCASNLLSKDYGKFVFSSLKNCVSTRILKMKEKAENGCYLSGVDYIPKLVPLILPTLLSASHFDDVKKDNFQDFKNLLKICVSEFKFLKDFIETGTYRKSRNITNCWDLIRYIIQEIGIRCAEHEFHYICACAILVHGKVNGFYKLFQVWNVCFKSTRRYCGLLVRDKQDLLQVMGEICDLLKWDKFWRKVQKNAGLNHIYSEWSNYFLH